MIQFLCEECLNKDAPEDRRQWLPQELCELKNCEHCGKLSPCMQVEDIPEIWNLNET